MELGPWKKKEAIKFWVLVCTAGGTFYKHTSFDDYKEAKEFAWSWSVRTKRKSKVMRGQSTIIQFSPEVSII